MPDRDEQLATLLNELLDCPELGQPARLESMTKDHPQLAEELRQLWATASLTCDLFSDSSFSSTPGDSPLSAAAKAQEKSPSSRASQPEGDQTTLIYSSRSPSNESGAVDPGEGDSSTAPEHNPSRKSFPFLQLEDSLPWTWGDYELIEEVGRGGMGIVFRARQISLDRRVALKMIRSGELAGPEEIVRFRQEAEAVGRLDHPNIVPLYEIGELRGQPFFSMKFVEGTNLAQLLSHGPLPSRQAAELLLPVCRGMASAHQQGVLHRDLKPSNILLDQEGTPFLSDFGLAKRIGPDKRISLTGTGSIVGTPSYMPPEQAAGRRGKLGPASDIYSLGAILYHILVGHPPFQADSHVDTILLVLEQDPLPPRLLNPQVDPDLELICLKCLQKPSELRYEMAEDLAQDLENFLHSEPISARSSSWRQIIGRLFGETHHAGVLENWGLLWIWHSLVLLVLCVTTNYFHVTGVESRFAYLGWWTLGLGTWAMIFWNLRRRAGPITFVERQIAHVWGASMLASVLLYVVEWQLKLPVLTLSPVLAILGGTAFLVKAAILSGRFYFHATILFATTLAMAQWPQIGLLLFGIICGLAFFIPGLKYYIQAKHTKERGSKPAVADLVQSSL
ncbi:Serine/threonine protein kinase PrkC, regulator of stationary phase [Planctomycetales bacterium 10988]|nr:Serine/threonine protein kinase PrkC, regulator of stationary phase [Planctomycetales bacterium 10988]